jgi:hypothetical protein
MHNVPRKACRNGGYPVVVLQGICRLRWLLCLKILKLDDSFLQHE